MIPVLLAGSELKASRSPRWSSSLVSTRRCRLVIGHRNGSFRMTAGPLNRDPPAAPSLSAIGADCCDATRRASRRCPSGRSCISTTHIPAVELPGTSRVSRRSSCGRRGGMLTSSPDERSRIAASTYHRLPPPTSGDLASTCSRGRDTRTREETASAARVLSDAVGSPKREHLRLNTDRKGTRMRVLGAAMSGFRVRAYCSVYDRGGGSCRRRDLIPLFCQSPALLFLARKRPGQPSAETPPVARPFLG